VIGKHSDLYPKDFYANVKYRREIIRMCGNDSEAAAQIRAICAEDILFYVNVACWTYDPRAQERGLPSSLPFITYDFQDDAFASICDCVDNGRDFAVAKSRDMGASWMAVTAYEWYWHFRDGLSFLFISRNEDYVDKRGNPKSLFWKVDYLHEHQPNWLLPSGRWLGWKDPNRRLLHVRNADNGSVIDGESTTGDAGRGDRRTAMLIDEHAAFNVDDSFRVLRASRDTTNCRGFTSTPQGSANGFYEVVHNTPAIVMRLHWSLHPIKNVGLYETDKENLKPRLLDSFRGKVTVRKKGEKKIVKVNYPDDYPFILDGKLRSPWYDNERARCVSDAEAGQELDIDFLGSDYQFFDPETISVLRNKYARPPLLIGDLVFDKETCEPVSFSENEKGSLMLWITLGGDGRVSTDRKFVSGADISAGSGASNSVWSCADRQTGEKIAVWRNSKTRPIPFAKVCVALNNFFNNAYFAWDASGPTGETFGKEVMRLGYGHIYYRRIEKKVGRKITNEPGYYLNPGARTALLEGYRESLGEHRFINRSDNGLKECLQFIRKMDGTVEHSASSSTQDPSGARTAHGDEVIADALCDLCLSERAYEKKSEQPEILEGSLAWRIRERQREQKKRTEDTLGDGW